MFDSLIATGVTVLVGIATIAVLGLAGHKNSAVAFLGVACTAGLSYILTLVHPTGVGELTTLWPLLAGLGFSALLTVITAADRPILPSEFNTRPDQRVINSATTSPQALADAPAKHWALG